jgi:RNA ligase
MGASQGDFIKFPRTPHLTGSKGTSDDKHLSPRHSAEFLAQESLVIEEKLDGTNVGIHFSDAGTLVLQCRGHLITEGMHPQYDMFKQWACAKQEHFAKFLQSRYVLFGEWMYAKHNIHYHKLPHLFFALDIFDKLEAVFHGYERRTEMIENLAVHVPPILHTGPAKFDRLKRLLTASQFDGHFEHPVTLRTDQLMEGLYLRIESKGNVIGRAKYVRHEFSEKVRQSADWRHQALVANELAKDADIWR